MTTINEADAVIYRLGQLGGGAASRVYAGSVQVWPPSLGYRDVIMATPGLVGYYRLAEPNNDVSLVDETTQNGGWFANEPIMGVPGPKLTAMRNGDANQGLGVVSGPFHDRFEDMPLPKFTGDPFAFRVLDLGDGPMTLEAWINLQGRIGIPYRGILSKGNGAYYLRLDGNNTLRWIQAAVYDMGGSTVPVPSTGWHHVVGTKNGAAMKLYIDGVDRTGPMDNRTLVNTTMQLFLSSDNQGGWHGEVLQGDLAEVAVYNQVLTPAQVLEHYNAMLA